MSNMLSNRACVALCATVASGAAAVALADQFQGAYPDFDPTSEQVTFAATEIRGPVGPQYLTGGSRRVAFAGGPSTGLIHVNRYDQDGDWLQNADWQFGQIGSVSMVHSMERQTGSNNVVLAGETNAFGAGLGVFLMRINPGLGWDAPFARIYSATPFADDPPCVSLRALPDASLTFTARRVRQTAMDGALIHTDANGTPIFFRYYFDPASPTFGRVSFNDVRPVDDGYVVVGYIAASATTPKSTLLLRTDPAGNFVWARVYMPIAIAAESTGQALDVLPDGRIAFVSRLITGGATVGSQFIMANPAGFPIWSRNYFGFVAAHAALELDDCGQVVCAGTVQTTLVGSDRSAATFLDLAGTPIRTIAYNVPRPEITHGKALELTGDGGTLVAGDRLSTANTPRDIHIAKGNALGVTGCNEMRFNPQIDARLPEVLTRSMQFNPDGASTFVQPVPITTQLAPDIYCSRCEGDLNGDGAVGLPDLAQLLATFGLCEGSAGYNPNADLTDDCSTCIGLSDLSRLLAVFGTVCP